MQKKHLKHKNAIKFENEICGNIRLIVSFDIGNFKQRTPSKREQ
jgi:hypothetical protein